MEFLREVYERRKKYFEQLEKYLEDIKEIVKKDAPDAEIYLYGSVAEGNFFNRIERYRCRNSLRQIQGQGKEA